MDPESMGFLLELPRGCKPQQPRPRLQNTFSMFVVRHLLKDEMRL
jgi:hypothetical protein